MWNQKVASLLIISAICLMSACANQPTGSQPNTRYNPGTQTSQQAEAHINLGAAYFRERKYEIALEEFELATRFDPRNPQAYNGLGLVYAILKQTNKANAAFEHAISLDPSNSAAQNNYGNFLCKNGKHNEAIPHFLEAIKNPLYKTPHVAYNNAGICAMRGKDRINAEKYFYNALRISPLMHNTAYNLAKLQLNRGAPEAAKKTLSNALISAPSPKILWLGIEIARKLGNQTDEAGYRIQLRKKFPDSQEAQQL